MRKTTSISCKDCESLDCSILKRCSPEWLEFIDRNKICFYVKKGNNILHEDTPSRGMHFIQNGKVKVFKSGINFKEQIIRLSKSGDLLGHRGWNRSEMPISAIALEDCKICFLHEKDFNKVLRNNNELTYELMLFYSDELYNSEVKARNLAQMNVLELVTDALLYILDVYGENAETGFLNVSLTRQEIADLSGTTKEQVSKYLSELNKDGVIETEKSLIKIKSVGKLKAISQKYIKH